MSILNKADDVERWKNKYLSLLDNQEQVEQSFQEHEQLLCKTIIRLTLASKGFNKQLDPHLDRIRKQLKRGLRSEKLKTELEAFSQSLMQLEDSATENFPDVTELFNFLLFHYSEPQLNNALQQLHIQYTKGKFNDCKMLFIAVQNCISTADKTTVTELNINQVNTHFISQQLLELFNKVEIPLAFEAQIAALQKHLQSGLTSATFQPAFDESLALLLKINHQIQLEQQDIEKFLATITEQLAELGEQALGTRLESQQQELNRHALDDSVSKQMQDLQLSSARATTLEALKQLINSRLNKITEQLQLHNQQETCRHQESQQQLHEMTGKIKQMESESSDLRSRLKIAHDQALRDPLTGLPNRLAYEERRAVEYARWLRYQAPLTLLIWDIDHFKQINDNYGHKSGDKTLCLIAKLLTSNCRQTDFVCRFGGEEFVMLLPDTNQESALKLADHIRRIIANTGFNFNGKAINITISCGISQFQAQISYEAVFEHADKALYLAKERGRNQCLIF